MRDSVRTKVQCVEYARRWLRDEMGLVYADVNIAADSYDYPCESLLVA